MITLTTTTDILFQVHKNHVSAPLPAQSTLRFTGFDGTQVTMNCNVQELSNCYLISVPVDQVDTSRLGLNARLEIGQGLYFSDVQLQLPA
ncbi:hypothetical protein [Hymenobacter siberiensis]|uniref:hypothetical protein n=1 Tax=Hymenobacter siberiensis TaxID=2848396 RepID=UPI001C1E30E4|nr:hypothetical protein [Hymenobacter siberiensis]